MVQGKIRVRLQAYDHRVIDQSAEKIVDVVVRTGAKVSGPIPLPTAHERWTVCRGPHIDKRSMEHFERRTHKRLIDIINPNPKVVDALTSLNLPAGVSVEIKM